VFDKHPSKGRAGRSPIFRVVNITCERDTAGSIRKQVSAEPKVVAGPAVSDDGGEPGDGGEGSASVALVVRPEVVTLRSSYR